MDLQQYARERFPLRDSRGMNKKFPYLYTALLSQTNFLPKKATIQQRLYHVYYDTYSVPLCKVCENERVSWNKKKQSYNKHCSISCRNRDAEYQQKYKQGMLNRYKTHNPMLNEEIKGKRIKNIKVKYGSTEAFFKKQSSSRKKNNQCKYGVDYTSKLPNIRLKIKLNNKNNNRTKKEKSNKTNQKKYGVINPSQRHITKESLIKLNDPEWLYKQHVDYSRTLNHIADELGVFCSTVAYKFNQHGISKQRFNGSQPQREIVSILQDHGVHVLQNDRDLIKPKELDIVLPEHKLAIEYCGLYWHSTARDVHYSNPRYHEQKLKQCNEKGYNLITIFEDEWIYKKQIVINTLLHKMGINTNERIYARNTQVKTLDYTPTVRRFLQQNHIQGDLPTTPTKTVGLIDAEQNIVALITFKKRTQEDIELTRFCTSKHVVGGFSKLLKNSKEILHGYTNIITFADLRWSTGNLYEKAGFQIDYNIPPDYYYVEGLQRIHKFNYRHKYLSSKLENYTPNLSEQQNTRMHQLYRIYNCGLIRWSMAIKNIC